MDADFADERGYYKRIEDELFQKIGNGSFHLRFICVICVHLRPAFDVLGGLAAKKTMEITKPLLSRG
ncbi:MAG: hypothetical protein DMD26_14285 [Gemmatimonadetes bacterium]|nr:MAG: hypothetical protein DMD26_14285 [Gemmatimonadota bacterium]